MSAQDIIYALFSLKFWVGLFKAEIIQITQGLCKIELRYLSLKKKQIQSHSFRLQFDDWIC